MISFRYYLDTRKAPRKLDARWPLKLAVTKRGDTALMPVAVYLLREEWDASAQRVTKAHPQRQHLNNYLDRLRMRVEELQRDLILSGLGAPMSATQVRDWIAARTLDTDDGVLLSEYFAKIRDEKTGRTRKLFSDAWTKFVSIEPRLDRMQVAQLDDATVLRIDKELTRRVAMSTRNTYISKLTQVTKRARAEGLLQSDPGRLVHLHYTVPKHRALTVEQLRTLFAIVPRTPIQVKALALFRMSFYLRAINPADILRNGPECIREGRIRYVRAKTGKLYDFPLEPEALELVRQWSCPGHLFAPLKAVEDAERYVGTYVDKALRSMALAAGLPPVTMYWARHTLASLIIDLGYTMEMAAAVLGHSYGPRVTAGYVTVQERAVNAVVRAVYDYVAAPSVAMAATQVADDAGQLA